MQRTRIVGFVGLLAFTLLCSWPAAAAPQPSAAPAPASGDCQEDLAWLGAPGANQLSDACWGHCYIEMHCPDFRYVGCYGSHPQACGYDGDYVVCDSQYYSCDQCLAEEPFALGCEYC